jgi:multiple sugar transport system substrate-binding protein
MYIVQVLFFVFLSSFLMAGGNSQTAGPQSGSSSEKITLNLWMAHTTSPEMNTKMQELAALYSKKYPHITVAYEPLVGDRSYPRMLAAAQSDNLPDVIEGNSHWPTQFAAMGRVMEVDTIMAKYQKDGTLDDFVEPQMYNKWKYQGHYYGIPWGAFPRIVFYRKDLLQRAGIPIPKTWEEFTNAVQKTTSEGIYGLTYPVAGTTFAQHYVWMMMFQAGGYVLDQNGKSAVKAKPVRDAFQYHTDFALKYNAMPPGAVSYQQDDSDLIFTQGRAVFAYSHGAMFDLIEKHSEIPLQNVGALPTLQGPGGRIGLQFYNPVFFAKSTKYPKEAIELGEWLCSEEVVIPLAQSRNGYLWPVKKSLLKHPYFTDNPNHLFRETAEGIIPFSKDVTWPFFSIPEWGPIDQEGQFAITASNIINKQKTLDQAINDLDTYITGIVEHK